MTENIYSYMGSVVDEFNKKDQEVKEEIIKKMLNIVGISTEGKHPFVLKKELEAKGIEIKFYVNDLGLPEEQFELSVKDTPIISIKGTVKYEEGKIIKNYERVEIK